MDCPQIPELNYAEVSLRIHNKCSEKEIPIVGEIDLTNHCNLQCVHCYIRDTHFGEELSYQEICRILDEVADAGCLWLCITGGEPLVRPDFRDIYSYAKRKGFLITLFSNGTLLTPNMVEFLAEQPPFVLDVSMYGMTAETYERVTGVPGSFARFMRGIELALARHLPLKLKTMILTVNAHEFFDMRQYAKSLGVPIRYDALINPRIDNSDEPIRYRLTPEEIVSMETKDPELADKLSKGLPELYGIHSRRENLYLCKAGKYNFHITSAGKLNICTLSHLPSYDLRKGSFNEGFFNIFPKIREIKRTRHSECQICPALNICGQCPAWAELELGDPETKVEFLCRTTKLRVDAFMNLSNLISK